MERRKDQDPERAIQTAVFQHLKQRGVPRSFAFHPINGGIHQKGRRRAINAGQGVVSGVPDVIIVREGQFFALELKKLSGKLSEAQIQCLEQLEAAGAICHVAYGLNDALRWLEANRLVKGGAA